MPPLGVDFAVRRPQVPEENLLEALFFVPERAAVVAARQRTTALDHALVEAELAADGFQTAVSATYPLHPSTLAYHRVKRWQAVCLEVRRDLLVDRFVPFVELRASPPKVARVAEPLVRAVRAMMQV